MSVSIWRKRNLLLFHFLLLSSSSSSSSFHRCASAICISCVCSSLQARLIWCSSTAGIISLHFVLLHFRSFFFLFLVHRCSSASLISLSLSAIILYRCSVIYVLGSYRLEPGWNDFIWRRINRPAILLAHSGSRLKCWYFIAYQTSIITENPCSSHVITIVVIVYGRLMELFISNVLCTT